MNYYILSIALLLLSSGKLLSENDNIGYYRFPAIHGETVVFTAEGDLWKVNTQGGLARRLTTHPGQETHASISPDGKFIAFTATYDGPREIYLIPAEGGSPKRLTYHGERSYTIGWTPSGKVMYTTRYFSALPGNQLITIDPETLVITILPLQQASSGTYDEAEETLFFTRLPFQGSRTKRYMGGTAQNLWKYSEAAEEAVPLTPDYKGTSKDPMWWNGRLYFLSDRDGIMNLWSMDAEGQDLRQETNHTLFDIQEPELHNDNIVYQSGADIYHYNIQSAKETMIPVSLVSDFEQRREKWISNPASSITGVDLSEKGDYISLTSRGRLFVAPVKTGRFIEVTRKYGIRYKNARFLPGTEDLILHSDESGEVEYWKVPIDGMIEPEQISFGSTILMNSGKPSPNGEFIVYSDHDLILWLLNVKDQTKQAIDTGKFSGIQSISWSPDSKWIAYVTGWRNQNDRIIIRNINSGVSKIVTTGRLDSNNPTWGPDGKWLYFRSEREFNPHVYSPWGPRQPEPYYDRTTKIFMLALQKDLKWPFLESNELMEKDQEERDEDDKEKEGNNDNPDKKKKKKIKDIRIDLDGVETRLYEVPVKSGNYYNLGITKSHIYYLDYVRDGDKNESILKSLKITNENPEPKNLISGVRRYILSPDGKKVLIQKGSNFYVTDANGDAPSKLEEKMVGISGWSFIVDPVEEWKQIYTDAWRQVRDYFYDPGLHGVDWTGIHERYLPLVDRVTDREELNDLISQVLGELSALHIYVRGGDIRRGKDNAYLSSLGARLQKDESAGGYRIEHIYRTDPDYPAEFSPLAKPHSSIREGDLIVKINGIRTLDADHPSALLRKLNQKQVRLTMKNSSDKQYEEIVKPISKGKEYNLRYSEWEYTRRLEVENKSDDQIGYIHMRAMGGDNYAEFLKGFYPVFDRQGLIIDMRNNTGGNIDAWVLEKLMRKAWMYWAPRAGQPYWNMHYAFRGHMICLVNERTSSDGEAFAMGFQRLGLGKVLGTRTWGGEIWYSSGLTILVDRGNATAAMSGVYDENGNWLIEGHGVDPDIVVDNLPHSTFKGSDAQLEAAIKYLQELIRKDPRPVPPVPPYPDKSFDPEK